MTSASVVSLFPPRARTAVPLHRRASILRRLLTGLDRWLCGLYGHDMVIDHSPDRLWLHCLSCGADTAGWTLDVRPEFRRPDAGRGRVLQYPTRSQTRAAA